MPALRRSLQFLTVSLSFVLLTGSAVVSAQSRTLLVDPLESDGVSKEVHLRQTAAQELLAGKYDELDSLAESMRREKPRGPGGAWMLHVFYSGLEIPSVHDSDWADHLNRIREWMTQRPESITARVALAQNLVRWAWVARGTGWANTVPPDRRAQFEERIAEAQKVLAGSEAMPRMCPQWFGVEMTVAIAQGWDDKRLQSLFERGVAFEPEYFYLYSDYETFLQPKWYGKPGQAAGFAREWADRLGGSAGDMLYFRIVAASANNGLGNTPPKTLDWPRIQRGYQLLQQAYGRSPRQANELALIAYELQDAPIARQQFAEIGNRWVRDVWRDRQHFDRARDWSTGRTAWP